MRQQMFPQLSKSVLADASNSILDAIQVGAKRKIHFLENYSIWNTTLLFLCLAINSIVAVTISFQLFISIYHVVCIYQVKTISNSAKHMLYVFTSGRMLPSAKHKWWGHHSWIKSTISPYFHPHPNPVHYLCKVTPIREGAYKSIDHL